MINFSGQFDERRTRLGRLANDDVTSLRVSQVPRFFRESLHSSGSALIIDTRRTDPNKDTRSLHLVVPQKYDRKVIDKSSDPEHVGHIDIPLDGVVHLKEDLPASTDINSSEFSTWLDKIMTQLCPIRVSKVLLTTDGPLGKYDMKVRPDPDEPQSTIDIISASDDHWEYKPAQYLITDPKHHADPLQMDPQNDRWSRGIFHSAREDVANKLMLG